MKSFYRLGQTLRGRYSFLFFLAGTRLVELRREKHVHVFVTLRLFMIKRKRGFHFRIAFQEIQIRGVDAVVACVLA